MRRDTNKVDPPIDPPILTSTPILTLNTTLTITLTTWLKAKDAANAKDKKIVQLEQELSDLNEVVLKQNEANEAKKRAIVEKNRIYQANYKKSRTFSNALLQLQQVQVCADPLLLHNYYPLCP